MKNIQVKLPSLDAHVNMPASFSIYLDLIRFIAALAVFITHLASFPFTKDVIWKPLGQFGDIAVTIFFLLSGYVISYVTSNRENNPEAYFGSRVSRLYSVILIALPLTFIFDTIGMTANPEFYAIQKVLWRPENWSGYISSFFFVNEYQIFGFNGISPGTNGPYWSLSFEATYYLLAGIVLFSRKFFWIPATIIILALAGRTITALLPIWLLGFVLYRLRVPKFKSVKYSQAIFCISALLIIFSPVITQHLPHITRWIYFPWGRGPFNRNLVDDYFIAFAFAIHLVSAKTLLSNGLQPFERFKSSLRWLGSLTFPLYLFHYPALCLFLAISPWGDTTIKRTIFITALTALVVITFTPLCDRFKVIIRNKFILSDLLHPKIFGWFRKLAKC